MEGLRPAREQFRNKGQFAALENYLSYPNYLQLLLPSSVEKAGPLRDTVLALVTRKWEDNFTAKYYFHQSVGPNSENKY